MDDSTPADYAGDSNDTETTPVDECLEAQDGVDSLFIYFLLVSVGLTFVLSFIVRRKNYFPGCLWGRPGLLQPVNFVDEVYRRWAYAACFVLLTNDVITLFFGESHLNLLPTYDKEWMEKFGFVKVFVKLLEALAICFVYYPLLACINHRHSIFANVIGILYLIPWIVVYSLMFYSCPISKQGNFLQSMDYILTIPMYIAFYTIGFSYILDLVANIMRKRKRHIKVIGRISSQTALAVDSSNEIKEQKQNYAMSHHFDYVGNLLRVRPKAVDETEDGIKKKAMLVMKRAKYDKILGFRYSTRLVCCTTTAGTLVIWIVVSISAVIDDVFKSYGKLCDVVAQVELLDFLAIICEYIYIAEILFHVANVMAGVIVLIFMVNTLITYKRRWHQLLRGDHSWHIYGTTIDSPAATLLNGLKYAGFQVAYAAWGWIVLAIVLWIILMFVAFAFIIPLRRGEINWLIKLLKKLWPTLILGIVIAIIQKLICRFLFLQDRGAVMALNNRRMYNAASYYFLVLNVIIGFFSCLKRILIPLVLGILFLSRLDQPLIMSGYESKDPGYVSFVSMLLVDLYHNHPVVKAFIELMLQVRKQEQSYTVINDEVLIESEKKRRRSKMIRNRWWKTITLANNPSLVLKALEQRLREEFNGDGQVTQLATCPDEDYSTIEMENIPKDHGIISDKQPPSFVGL